MGLCGPSCVGETERGICVAGASPYCARYCWWVGCAYFDDFRTTCAFSFFGCSFFSSFFFGGGIFRSAMGIASGGGTDAMLGKGGAGDGDGISVASTLGVGGVSCGSGIEGAELTSVA